MDKPFKTIEDQLALLVSRGLKVDESAEGVLRREGYYAVVNGYKDPFIDQDASAMAGDDRFKKNTSFDDLYSLFQFDRELRMVLFKYFAVAEATFKSVCSYHFAEAHKNVHEAYLSIESYAFRKGEKHAVERLIRDLAKITERSESNSFKRKRQYIEHYVDKHDNVPIWVLVNFLMLGQVFKFYCFQPESLQNRIAKTFSALYSDNYGESCAVRITPRMLRLAFDHIKDFRNICAHDERLYCARVAPSKDILLGDVVDDLALVLKREEHAQLCKEIYELRKKLEGKLGREKAMGIFRLMRSENVIE